MHPFTPPAGERAKALTRPRPGHADLAGALKLGLHDARDVLERSSARSTAARVAAGAVCKALLGACGIEIMCHVDAHRRRRGAAAGRARRARTARGARAPPRHRTCAASTATASARWSTAIKAAQKDGDSRRWRRRGGGVERAAGARHRTSSGTERLDGRLAHGADVDPGDEGRGDRRSASRRRRRAARRCSIPSCTTARASCGRRTTWAASRAASPTASRWSRARR